MSSGILRLGRFVPKTLADWDKVFRPLNEMITQTPSGKQIAADNMPAQDAAYVTLSSNATLTGDRVLTAKAGETTVTDNGAGSTVIIGLANKGTPGTYPKVVTDSKGRVVSGGTLERADMPAPLGRIYSGTGTPNGVVTSSPGALYLNLSGGANATLYVKESGMGNTGWVAK